MKLFSKRNKSIAPIVDNKPFLNTLLRNRLFQEIEYISSTDEFLERCFLVEDENKNRWFLDNESMKKLSSRELGYNITDHFNFTNFTLISGEKMVSDYALFDLIEILLIFSKEESRKLIRERFQKHFLEEGDEYVVYDFLIARKNLDGLGSYVSILKDKVLKNKLQQYYDTSANPLKNYELLARISADIVQFIFSATKKGETKSYTEKFIKELAKKYVDEEKILEFSKILNNIIVNAKSLNNEITNIRHTDRSTLLVESPVLFKLIATNNIHLAELVISAAPENYFFSQKAIDFKNEYIAKYKIPVEGWVIKKPKNNDEEIKLEDIPF